MSHSILHLDDDPGFLTRVSELLNRSGYRTCSASNVEEAKRFMQSHDISCAIVDLFLEGDRGDLLSNNFIEQYLVNVPYARLTSAPKLVPPKFSGSGIVHKYHFLDNPSLLLNLIIEMTAAAGT
ncbi:MAG: hypothetical protein KDD66_13090 [Bdellovibrionales bacterium]|nr:hypothetical protein [Bdellovibrionales bacterium]